MQISLCFRIISFFKKANKLWVSTLRVQRVSVKISMVNMKKNYGPVYEKNTLLSHSSGKGDPASPEKCALIFLFFFLFTSELMCTVLCVDFQASEEGKGRPCYTIVQTVFKLGSNRTAFPSTDLALVSYMGFSNAAWPLLFSWTEQPVYCVLGAVLLMRTLISYASTFS